MQQALRSSRETLSKALAARFSTFLSVFPFKWSFVAFLGAPVEVSLRCIRSSFFVSMAADESC